MEEIIQNYITLSKMIIQYRNDNQEIFAPLRNNWCKATPQEVIRQKFIFTLLHEYNYVLEQMQQDFYSNSGIADIVVWQDEYNKTQNNIPLIVVICVDSSYTQEQDYLLVENYALASNCTFFTIAYHDDFRVFCFQEDEGGLGLMELEYFPDFQLVRSKSFLRVKRFRSLALESLKKSFFQCNDFIRNSTYYSPNDIGEFVRILSAKINYERATGYTFTSIQAEQIRNHHPEYFRFNDRDLFDRADLDAVKYSFTISQVVFFRVLDTLQHYNFAIMAKDVLGSTYDEFLELVFKRDLNGVFTSRVIINFMINILSPQKGESIYDPCCGTGGFLIKSYLYRNSGLDKTVWLKKKKLKSSYGDNALYPQKQIDLVRELSKLDVNTESPDLDIWGEDINKSIIEIAQMNMKMHGSIHDNLFTCNVLESEYFSVKENRMDVVFANPPYGVKKMISNDSNIGGYFNYESFLSGSESIETLFIEKCIHSLKKGGRMGIILPESFLSSTHLDNVRLFIESKAKILFIVSLPSSKLFLNSPINKSLVFLRKFTDSEELIYRAAEKQVTRQSNEKNVLISTTDIRLKVRKELSYKYPVAEIKIDSQNIKNQEALLQELMVIQKEYEEYCRYNYLQDDSSNTNITAEPVLLYYNKSKDWSRLRILFSGDNVSWSVPYGISNTSMVSSKYDSYKLGDLIKRNRDIIDIKDGYVYTRITVKINREGLVLRNVAYGKDIGTKKQFMVKEGQFIFSKIDVENGAFGLVPKEMDGAIVTNDFPVYDIDLSLILPDYLILVLSTKSFQSYCQNNTNGAVIKRIKEDVFLSYLIPLPSLELQEKLILKYKEAEVLKIQGRNLLGRASELSKEAVIELEKELFD